MGNRTVFRGEMSQESSYMVASGNGSFFPFIRATVICAAAIQPRPGPIFTPCARRKPILLYSETTESQSRRWRLSKWRHQSSILCFQSLWLRCSLSGREMFASLMMTPRNLCYAMSSLGTKSDEKDR